MGRWRDCRSCWAALTAASCSAFSAAARASAAATSMSWALAGFITGGPGIGDGAFFGGADGVAFLGGAGFADTLGSPADAAIAGAGAATGATGAADPEAPASSDARSRRATGASTVLDADFTYSPSS